MYLKYLYYSRMCTTVFALVLFIYFALHFIGLIGHIIYLHASGIFFLSLNLCRCLKCYLVFMCTTDVYLHCWFLNVLHYFFKVCNKLLVSSGPISKMLRGNLCVWFFNYNQTILQNAQDCFQSISLSANTTYNAEPRSNGRYLLCRMSLVWSELNWVKCTLEIITLIYISCIQGACLRRTVAYNKNVNKRSVG